jgi:hypothetical protein
MRGGEYKDESSDSESEIDDDLHDKLLGLVREHDVKSAGLKKKKSRRQQPTKKTTTRKKKML